MADGGNRPARLKWGDPVSGLRGERGPVWALGEHTAGARGGAVEAADGGDGGGAGGGGV